MSEPIAKAEPSRPHRAAPRLALLCGLALVLSCGNLLVPLWRWHLLFGYGHERVKDLAGVTQYTEIQFPPGAQLIDAEIVDSLSSGSAIFAHLTLPKQAFPAFARDPRYQSILLKGDAAVRDYSADLWPEVRSRWNLPFSGHGVVGGKKFAHAGFIA